MSEKDVVLYAVPIFFCATLLMAAIVRRLKFPLAEIEARYNAVDGLRGFLALAVMAHHYSIWTSYSAGGAWRAPESNVLSQFGNASVALFFVVTGFVFTPRIQRGIKAIRWGVVYIRRVFRILPLVIFSVFCVLMIASFRTGNSPLEVRLPDLALWISSTGEPDLLGLKDTGSINARVLWSLLYEWCFYIAIMPCSALAFTLLRSACRPVMQTDSDGNATACL